MTLVSPDMGGIRRIKILSEMLGGMPFAVVEKNRDLASGKVSASKIEGATNTDNIIELIRVLGNTLLFKVWIKSFFILFPVTSDNWSKL